MILYHLDRISQCYAGRTVLAIDSLEIEAGRIYGLLGPNGAGKTTLLKLLALLEPPTTGRLSFAGCEVAYTRSALLALRRQVVLVDQHPIMFSTSVGGNVDFGLKIRRIDKEKRQRIIDEVLETVGLRPFKAAAAHELSGGETQRLALARALALSPAVLLCDEPTASVDVENQAIIAGLLQTINSTRGTTVIFTTHDRLQAAALAQQTLVLENGQLAPTTYENAYPCTLTQGADGRWYALLPTGAALALAIEPPSGPSSATDARVYIDPEKITLHRHRDHRDGRDGQEAGTTLSGTVILLMAENDRIRVVVNIGLLLVVLMDRADYQQHPPAIGETVLLEVIAEAVTLLNAGRR